MDNQNQNQNNSNNQNHANLEQQVPNNQNLNEWTRTEIFTIIKAVIAIAYTCAAIVNDTTASLPEKEFTCIYDFFHVHTESINKFLMSDINARYALIITSALLIYFVLVYCIVMWIKESKSWQFMGALGIFAVYKMITQFISRMKEPTGFPPKTDLTGFLRIFNHFMRDKEFFFSTWVGIPIICACEFYRIKNYWMFGISLFSSLFEIITMMFTRGHYFCDIFAGAIIGHYIYISMNLVLKLFDESEISINPDYKPPVEGEEDKKSHKS